MKHFAYLAVLGIASAAWATDEPAHETPEPVVVASASASAVAAAASTATAQGGTGGSGGNAAADATGGQATSAGGAASNSFSERSSFLSVNAAAPVPVAVEGVTVPPCWLPTAARSYGFGIYANSSRYKRNKACLRDLEAARAHEIAVATATVDRSDTSAGTAETCREYANRVHEACNAK